MKKKTKKSKKKKSKKEESSSSSEATDSEEDSDAQSSSEESEDEKTSYSTSDGLPGFQKDWEALKKISRIISVTVGYSRKWVRVRDSLVSLLHKNATHLADQTLSTKERTLREHLDRKGRKCLKRLNIIAAPKKDRSAYVGPRMREEEQSQAANSDIDMSTDRTQVSCMKLFGVLNKKRKNSFMHETFYL